eukprot:TRINITY_DN13225_c0_g1_i13.p1 TRINITY_DN13225_c0_g1~~TRINITY_DN13225_c0_g1_i13.p1  ORF type:complete len:319 (-),score=51.46 TRINITY_DN13225_c0_g1_i13:1260-2216(-)
MCIRDSLSCTSKMPRGRSTRCSRAVAFICGTLIVVGLLRSWNAGSIEYNPLAAQHTELLEGGIPMIIHQTWSDTAVPSKFAENIRSWVKWHPRWRYKFWTDKDNRMLVQSKFPGFLETFDRLGDGSSPGYVKRKKIRQADAIRYMLLYQFGGFYMDLDFEALGSLSSVGSSHDIVIGQEPLVHAHLLNGLKQTICNAILGSRPKHPFWLAVLNHIKKRSGSTGDPVDATGPRMMEKVLAAWAKSKYADKYPVWVAPDTLFYPQWDPAQLENLKRTCARIEQEFKTSGAASAQGSSSTCCVRLSAYSLGVGLEARHLSD